MPSSEIVKREDHDLLSGGEGGLTSFFVPGEIDKAFRENDYAVTEMISTLCDIVRSKDMRIITRKDGMIIEEPVCTPRDVMAALKMLDDKAMKGMVLGGLIQNDRLEFRRNLGDGTVAEYSQEGLRLVTKGSDRLRSTLALLEKAGDSGSDEVIDVEIESESGNDGRDAVGRERAAPGPGGRGSDGGKSRDVGSGGDGVRSKIHGGKRADPGDTHREGEYNDNGTIRGADDERKEGLPITATRGGEGQEDGKEDGVDGDRDRSDFGPSKRPIIIGGNSLSRASWCDPGIPKGSGEGISDRLARIARATGYAERRANDNSPPDERGTDSGSPPDTAE